MTAAYDFRFDALQGGELPLSRFAGRPLLIVNTASRCGFTPQYAGLQQLWVEQRHTGLVLIGVPCNDFGAQEPGSEAEIGAFCATRFGVDFPLTAKAHVRGPERHPLFIWLAEQGGFLSRPRWNFYKYLIDREGRLTGWFTFLTRPDAPRLRRAVDRLVMGSNGP
ncbi:MAG: glutathione peroxidase [Acetobacteraceae bacterium]